MTDEPVKTPPDAARGNTGALRPGDILLFDRATRANRLITLLSRSPYYHVAIYAGEGYVVEARPAGVIQRDLWGPMGTHHGAVLPAPGGRGEAALAWARGRIGSGYDRADVVVIVLEHLFRRLRLNYAPADRYSCAEFVAEAYRAVGEDLFPGRDSSGIDPADFATLLPPGFATRDFV